MDYNNFIREIPDETKKIIIKALEIYAVIEHKEIFCNFTGILNSSKRTKISKLDKCCISIFLAGLIVDGDVKTIFKDTDQTINLDIFMTYLGIDESYIKTLTEEEYSSYFNNNFKLTTKSLISSQDYLYGKLPKRAIFPEMLIANLAYNSICGTNIIENIFNDIKKLNCHSLYDIPAFKLLKTSFKQKIEDMKIQPKNDSNMKKTFHPTSQIETDTLLEKYGEDLTFRNFISNPAIGREKEIKDLIIALITPEKSAVLVGEPGVGKTAIVEGLAYFIKNKKVPKLIENIRIVKINVSTLLQGCMFVGMFEERVEKLIEELINQPNTYLFIDELHNVIGAGSGSKKDMDLANILKPYLDRGQIKVIGATTTDEYEEILAKDKAFKRRFERVNVLEPDVNTIKQILYGSIEKISQVMNIKFIFENEILEKVIELIIEATSSINRFYNDKVNNPDLALTILKKSFAHAAYNEHSNVLLSDIAESLKSCDRLNENSRLRYANIILNIQTENNKTKNNIIKFPTR